MNDVQLQPCWSAAEETNVAVLGRCAREVPGGSDAARGGAFTFEGGQGGLNSEKDYLGDALGDEDATAEAAAKLLLARLIAQDEAQCE